MFLGCFIRNSSSLMKRGLTISFLRFLLALISQEISESTHASFLKMGSLRRYSHFFKGNVYQTM